MTSTQTYTDPHVEIIVKITHDDYKTWSDLEAKWREFFELFGLIIKK